MDLPRNSRQPTFAVPLVDYTAQFEDLKTEIRETIERVMAGGQYVLGPEVDRFEAEFATYCGVRHCVGVGSGMDALRMILRAYGVGPGDEVITAGNAFIATSLAISMTGATPVLVDHDPATYTIDPDKAAAAVTPRTKAIVPVHLYGQPADMRPILRLARSTGLRVIEDAGQAHGAEYEGHRCGSLADAAAFSFHPSTNLGAYGDGGAITTNDDALAARLRMRRNYGSAREGVHDIPGCNSRLDSLHAAVLRIKLRKLDEWNARRRVLAATYSRRLGGTPVTLPRTAEGRSPAHHLYVIRTPRRDEVLDFLRANGIEAGVHYAIPIHRQRAYARLPLRCMDLANTETFAGQLLSLPIYPEMPQGDVVRVAQAIRSVLGVEEPVGVAYPQLTVARGEVAPAGAAVHAHPSRTPATAPVVLTHA